MERKIIIVRKESRYDELLNRFSTHGQAVFYLESRGLSINTYLTEHIILEKAVRHVRDIIPQGVRTQILERSFLPTFKFGQNDLIIAIGGTGILINTAKYLNEQQIMLYDPTNSSSRFSTCNKDNIIDYILAGLNNKLEISLLTMAEAKLDNGQVIRAINDLFIGRKTHVSSRYRIFFDKQNEVQSSSGIIISTGTGSTGWLTSILTGSHNICKANNLINTNINENFGSFEKDSNQLKFAVREPFPSANSKAKMVFGAINEENQLEIESHMPHEGVIFSDGIEEDFLEFTSGRIAKIYPAKDKVHLVSGVYE